MARSSSPDCAVSVIIPALNEAGNLPALLGDLRPALDSREVEVIVVDGGSDDGTPALAAAAGALVVAAERGRARQMNAGARLARGEVLLFLHADSRLAPDVDPVGLVACCHGAHAWGRFDVAISGGHPLFGVIAGAMNLRSRLTGIATGDQGIFVRRDLFEALGGFPGQPLMEDIALSARLRALARPLCLRARLVTSGRRWQRDGVIRTVLLMWWLRLAYWLGAPPERLARCYYRVAPQRQPLP
jgi:rSAM/selenodomain-associated transferase 2